MSGTTIDITKLVDDQKVSRFTVFLVLLSFCVMLTDGYDLLAAAHGGPSLVRDWKIAPAQLGPVFSASPFGIMLGAPLLGWFGDRFGRRRTVILGTVIFGVFSLGCAMANSVPQLMVLRFLTGIGLGGMMPNITALNAEFAPRRVRATCVVLMFTGVTAGSLLPGVAIAAMPEAGWRGLYFIGGIVPLVMAAVMWVWLPESIKFLALQQGARARAALARTVRRIRPDLAITPATVFVNSEGKGHGRAPVMDLFRDGMGWITALLWLLFIVNLAANYFLYSWMPIVFSANGFTPAQAALTSGCYYVGGVAGGVTASRLIDRFGLPAITAFFLFSTPAVACIGLPGLPQLAVAALVGLGGFGVFGVQLGLNAVAGLIYPTRVRSSGVGWAFGVGRVGGILGPMVGAWLVARHLPMSTLFIAPAVPLAIGFFACAALWHLCRIRFAGRRLGDAVPSAAA